MNEKKIIALPDVASGLSVPRIIHQNFFPGWDVLPPEIKNNISALLSINSGWEYCFYDDAASERFIKNFYGDSILNFYRRIDPAYYAARSDLLRYLIMYMKGGVYLDMKSYSSKPLDDIVRPDDVYILSRGKRRVETTFNKSQWKAQMKKAGPAAPSHEYIQWFMVAAPGHPFLKATIEAVLENIESYNVFVDGVGRKAVLRLTGPVAYAFAVEPLRSQHNYRFADVEADLGFTFSVYSEQLGHRRALGRHYSELRHPIVVQSPVSTAGAFAWFRILRPRVFRVREALRWPRA